MKIKNNYKIERKELNKMAYPTLLNYLLTSLFEMMDKAIVGHHTIDGFALVSICANIIFAVTGALGILSVCFNIVGAEKIGKNQDKEFEKIFVVCKQITLVIGLLFFVLSLLGGRLFFSTFYKLDAASLDILLPYLYPAAFTVLQNMLIFIYSAYYRNRLNTKINVISTAVSMSVNIFFDYSLVFGKFGLPDLGVSGAAWGSTIGLACGLLVYQLPYFTKRIQSIRDKMFYWDMNVAKNVLKLYPSLLGQEFIESTLFVILLTGAITRLGQLQMSSYSLYDTVCGIIGLPMFAYATAAQTYAMQSFSADKKNKTKVYLYCGISQTLKFVVPLALLCVVFSKYIFSFIIIDEVTIAYASKFLILAIVLLIIKIPYQINLMFLQGTSFEKYAFMCTVISTLIAGVIIYLGYNHLTLVGVYVVMMIQYTVLNLIYMSKKKRALS